MPPKSLFDGSHRPDKLVMPACKKCNSGTSTSDLVTSIVSRWRYETTDQQHLDHAKLVARLKKEAPEIVAEWLSGDDSLRDRSRQNLKQHGVHVPEDAALAHISTRTIRQLNLFSYKLVLSLYYEHLKKPLTDSGCVCAYWKTQDDFASDGVPKILTEMLRKYGSLVQGRWNAREIFEYRHDANSTDGLFGCFARLRHGIFVIGFAVADSSSNPQTGSDWIIPSQLLSSIDAPRFGKKL
jgi:hypothetical protein